MEPIRIEITDTLDLHIFKPSEVKELLDDYFLECVSRDIFSVRLIHGKGQGILKKKVQSLLKKNLLVVSFKDAPPEAGGWGATLVELKKKKHE